MQLGHKRLAEAHHLGVRAAFRVEVRAALGSPDRHAGQRVLEHLVKAEELDDAEVDRRVKPQAPLVWPERAVELRPEAPVDVNLAVVIGPDHPEDDLALRLADTLEQLGRDVLGMLGEHWPDALENAPHRLVELGLAGIAPLYSRVQRLQVLVDEKRCRVPPLGGGPMKHGQRRRLASGGHGQLQFHFGLRTAGDCVSAGRAGGAAKTEGGRRTTAPKWRVLPIPHLVRRSGWISG